MRLHQKERRFLESFLQKQKLSASRSMEQQVDTLRRGQAVLETEQRRHFEQV